LNPGVKIVNPGPGSQLRTPPGGHNYEPHPGVTATNPTRGSQLRPTNHHKQPSETTKTRTRELSSPAKRKIGRGTRDTSSSFLSLDFKEGEGMNVNPQPPAVSTSPAPAPISPRAGVDTPKEEGEGETLLQGRDSNPRSSGYGPDDLPLVHPAIDGADSATNPVPVNGRRVIIPVTPMGVDHSSRSSDHSM
jgi:hypothetical protein